MVHCCRSFWRAIVDADGKPLRIGDQHERFSILVTPMEARVDLENVSAARILSVQCREAMDTDVPCFNASMRVRDGPVNFCAMARRFVVRDVGLRFRDLPHARRVEPAAHTSLHRS